MIVIDACQAARRSPGRSAVGNDHGIRCLLVHIKDEALRQWCESWEFESSTAARRRRSVIGEAIKLTGASCNTLKQHFCAHWLNAACWPGTAVTVGSGTACAERLRNAGSISASGIEPAAKSIRS